MGFFAAATGMNCTQCHVEESGGSWAKCADETPLKKDGAQNDRDDGTINRTLFQRATCRDLLFLPSRGTRPEVATRLALQ